MDKKLTYQKVVTAVCMLVSLFAVIIHVGNYTTFTMPSILFYAWHLLIGLVLIFLYKPLGGSKELSPGMRTLCRAVDWILIALTAVVSFYVIFNFETYTTTMQNNMMTKELYVFGIIITLLVLEAGRRMLGNVLPIIAIVAIIYALTGDKIPGLFGHRGYSMQRVVLAIFSDRGVYGTPIGTSATNVYLFLLFAAFLSVSGADIIFQNIAIAAAGRKRGGPAKMAVIASAFFGTISGSCVANVVSTGAFTIPLMKRNGYPKKFAGAVEAVASTGGQIMPPIMGAAAFVLSDVAGVPYAEVCIAAILPALMYYICLVKMVDLEAVKHNLAGLSEDEVPNLKESLARGMKLFIPVGVLLFMMLGLKTTPMKAAIFATAAILVTGVLDSKDRMTLKGVVNGAVAAGKSLCSVVAACSTAGIVVAVFSLTGLGLKFSNFIVQLGSNSLIPSLILAMLVCAILGMGLPTTAAYIVCATAIAPALTGLGLPILAAHLFLMYFASISAITPPVAVASYAAAGIAEENPMKVGLQAVKLGITGFILPFAFALNPDYITFGWNLQTLLTWISGMVVCYSLAIMLQGYVESRITVLERLAYLAVIVLAITPYMLNSLIGFVLFAALYGFRKWQAKRAPLLASS
ncbi:TRAP transporter permease [Enterocloster asparagiformis]|uniref:TRAP transporter, 4TM/12TM fusion protein n=2 Tax=Enterocloster asparagiformis TaxID=333367 RepID=C0CV51_9FIRM|nr:TRAP transporter fused permease subunit [Enterocloster asparagiformis]EEG57034.1 TRAP transporter, 4TM/12TM fusion protein [[Clostridium] asparagiforme DSM 15981]RGX28831.1 C4-dicarboxylate ABC transporter [Enterocloster asparagiformis]UWO77016.1 TRAP transporter fused permease subunit [[Clostridium] asparagiforme DSM 15981]